ncbi:hypothetical protein [Sphingomonas metalli]|nr:hypothetical protein [Sphingomonas metalli]
MSRAFDFFFGTCMVGTIWLWMAQSFSADTATGLLWWVLAIGKVVAACFITGPVYREYLR